ncbi:MAG: DUF5077 domain-containing protein, partial [Chitinophagaceae bacterium]
MILKKTLLYMLTSALSALIVTSACSKPAEETKATIDPEEVPSVAALNIKVPLAGNAYITTLGAAEEINENGLANWTSQTAVTSTYFRVSKKGLLSIGLRGKVVGGNSTVKLTVNGKSFNVKLSGEAVTSYPAGNITLTDTGYIKVDLQGVSKTGNYFGDIAEILIGGPATTGDLVFANDPENYYWSRRGPSCHLNYTIPSEDKEYFYSELTVPEGEDVPGSYFMANGFGEGYFGIQVKSATERWILFSVWDPAEGNGMTQLVRKGDDITAQRFGGEGTGGQSYMVFNWKAGTAYKFLTRGKPDG